MGLTEVEDHDVVLGISFEEGGVSNILDESFAILGGADGTSNSLGDTEDINIDGKINGTRSARDGGI